MSTSSAHINVSVTSTISSTNLSTISIISRSTHLNSQTQNANDFEHEMKGKIGENDGVRVVTCRKRLTNNRTKNLNLLLIRRKRIIGQNPPLHTKKSRHTCLFNLWILFLEFVRKSKTHDRQSSDVFLRIIVAGSSELAVLS